jgi:hypothetical protein
MHRDDLLPSVRMLVKRLLDKGRTPREIADAGVCTYAYAIRVRKEWKVARG